MNRAKCQHCLGRGWELSHPSVGHEVWALRKNAALSISEVARRMGIDRSYLSYLEEGKRRWTLRLYEAAIKAVGEGR